MPNVRQASWNALWRRATLIMAHEQPTVEEPRTVKMNIYIDEEKYEIDIM